MTSLKDILTKLKNGNTDLSQITFEKIKESFDDLDHNPEEKIDLEYYEVLRDCLNVYIHNVYPKTEAESKKAYDILKLFLSVKFSDESTLLYNLIEKEDLEENSELRELIELLIDISSPEQLDAKDKEGKTLLHLAAKNRKLELVKILIQKKAASGKEADLEYYEVLRDCLNVCINNINSPKAETNDILKLSLSVKFTDRKTLLHNLIDKENLAKNSELTKLTKLLIKISSPEELNAKCQYKFTPLHYAVLRKQSEIVQSLIESKKADVNAKNMYWMTPLHIAIQVKNENIVKLLIKLDDIDINAKDEYERTPLHLAASRGKLEAVNYLINSGKADVKAENNQGETPLHLAAENGDKETVDSLITAGADVVAKDKKGNAPLHLAAENGHKDTVDYLITTGADVKAENDEGETPLHLAAENGDKETVNSLITAGADVVAKDKNGNTPLHLAASRGKLEAVNYLINSGKADVKTENDEGKTPLHLAAFRGKLEAVNYLVTTGADVDAKDKKGNTPLHLATSRGHKETVDSLITAGADVVAKNDEGQTPLYLAAEYAAEYKDLTVVNYLIPKKADAENKFELDYYKVFKKCLEVCINDINSTYDKDKTKAEAILKLLLSVKFLGEKTMLHLLIEEDLEENSEPIKLHFLFQKDLEKNSKLIKLLINNSNTEQLNAEDEFGYTPLYWAAKKGKLQILNLLMQKKAENEGEVILKSYYYQAFKESLKFCINNNNNSHYVDKKENLKNLRNLLSVQFLDTGTLLDVVIKNDHNILRSLLSVKFSGKKTLLHVLIEKKDLDIKENLERIKLLINKSSAEQLNDKNDEGQTPLHLAALHGKLDVVEYLIKEKANVNAKDKYGKTPLDYAKSLDDTIYSNKQNIIDLLEKELSKHKAKKAFYKTAMITTITASITATILFTTGTLASTELNIIYVAGIIALSTFIITNLVYGTALEIYSTPKPKLENSATEENIAQVTSVA